jgi:hypothetical protein
MNGLIDTRVEELLERVVRFHPCSLRLLTGEIPDLDPGDIPRLVEGSSDTSGKGLEEALDSIGGWKGVTGAVKAYRKSRPREWQIFADHVIWVEVGGTSRLSGESQLDRIAEKHGVSRDTVQRRRKQVVSAIARMTSSGRAA